MKNSPARIEALEIRQFLSVTPAAARGAIYDSGPMATDYVGTATNQSHKTTPFYAVLTDIKGVRTGVVYVTNNAGGKTPVNFTFNSNLTFSFKFALPGEKDSVTGKLSANGETVSGKWTSVTSKGVKGSGTFSANQVANSTAA